MEGQDAEGQDAQRRDAQRRDAQRRDAQRRDAQRRDAQRRDGSQDLSATLVSELVAVRFPDLAGAPVSRLGAGCDHELFLVGDEWIFRFPKRAERVAWLRREIQVVAIAAEALGDRVPRFERIAEPSATFPYPFVGYRRLAGVGADQVTDGDRAELAADIGRVLSGLHRIDPARIPAVPGGGQRASWDELRADLAAVGHLARPLLAAGLLAEAEPYLAGQVAAPARAGPRRFIHNDVSPDHVIVDPVTGRLVGLIDFGDALVGEVALDFVGLLGIGGYGFISQVAAAYDLPLGSGFAASLEWVSRTLTLTWLADTAVHDPGDIPKHQSWVARAFGR